MPFSWLKFLVRLLNVVVFVLCIYSYSTVSAQLPTRANAGSASRGAAIQSYSEWKAERLKSAQNRIENLRSKISLKKSDLIRAAKLHGKDSAPTKDRHYLALNEQLKIEQESLSFAHDLNIADYLMSYLLRHKKKSGAFAEAAAKMTPSEVAELIEAYSQKVMQGGGRMLPPTAESLSNLPY